MLEAQHIDGRSTMTEDIGDGDEDAQPQRTPLLGRDTGPFWAVSTTIMLPSALRHPRFSVERSRPGVSPRAVSPIAFSFSIAHLPINTSVPTISAISRSLSSQCSVSSLLVASFSAGCVYSSNQAFVLGSSYIKPGFFDSFPSDPSDSAPQ